MTTHIVFHKNSATLYTDNGMTNVQHWTQTSAVNHDAVSLNAHTVRGNRAVTNTQLR